MKFTSVLLCVLVGWCLSAGSDASAAPIHAAVASGDVEKVSGELAKDGAAVNLPDDQGLTPLHMAVGRKDAKIANLLLSKGADPAARDRSGRTSLRIAVDSNAADCVKELVAKTTVGYIDPLLDARQKEGADALRDGTLAKAGEMLGRLVRLDPNSESLNFAYGLSWLSLGDPAPAGVALERVLQINPKNNRARAELARARLSAKRYSEARKEIESVLASDLPSEVKQTLEACLKDAKRHMTRWYYSGSLDLSGLYDSNVNVGPDAESIHIAPMTLFGVNLTELEISDASRPTETMGVSLAADARTLYDMGRENGWFWTSDGNGYCNWLEESDYETASVQAGLGAKLMLARSFFQIPFRTRYVEYGGEPLVWTYGCYPVFIYMPASVNGLSFITLSSVELRDFDTLTDRDGCYLSLGEIVKRSFAGGRYSLYGGAEGQHDYADSSEYEYSGAGLMIGGDVKLPWRLGLFGEGRYSYRDYQGRNSLAPKDRSDNQYQLSVGVSRAISDWSALSVTYNLIDNDSTFDLYEYERQITAVGVRVKF